MKKLITIVVIILSVFLLSCKNKSNESSGRIKFVTSETIKGCRYTIISIDSVKYVTSTRGGIIKL